MSFGERGVKTDLPTAGSCSAGTFAEAMGNPFLALFGGGAMWRPIFWNTLTSISLDVLLILTQRLHMAVHWFFRMTPYAEHLKI